jgi:redox-sensing transcriptional repressor
MKATGSNPRHHDIPEASLRRLPLYYRCLQDMKSTGSALAVSCADLARTLGLDPTLVRKDIEMTGIIGKPRVGYPLGALASWIENFLGLNRPKAAVLAGTGSLGSALLGYQKFRTHGMQIVAAFDVDSEKIGQRIHGTEVQPLFFLPEFVRNAGIPLGLIATPAGAAQSVADLMVSGGVSAIWNFAPAHIHVPEGIILQNEDLYHSLASLSFKLESRSKVTPLESEIYGKNN